MSCQGDIKKPFAVQGRPVGLAACRTVAVKLYQLLPMLAYQHVCFDQSFLGQRRPGVQKKLAMTVVHVAC